MPQVIACTSVTLSSSALERYGKSWKDIATVASDSAQCTKKAVRDTGHSENLSILHVTDLLRPVHVDVSGVSLRKSVADVRPVVTMFGALFKHASQLYQCHVPGMHVKCVELTNIKKTPALFHCAGTVPSRHCLWSSLSSETLKISAMMLVTKCLQ